MNEQKRNRIAAAITVNVILLIVVLVAVIIYQLVYMSIVSSKKKQIEAEIARYQALIESGEMDLETLQSDQYLLELALKYGFYFPDGD